MDAGPASLSYRAPYDWPALIDFLAARAIQGVEVVEGGVYRRTFRSPEGAGVLEVRHQPEAAALELHSVGAALTDEMLGRVRCVFDLDADMAVIGAHLARDPTLRPLVAARPGLRTPGGWDGFELAVRAVLGQQVTVTAARRLAGFLVALCGPPAPPVPGGDPALGRLFPTAAEVAAADLASLPMPGARKRALRAMAEAALADPGLFERGEDLEATVARLRAVPGVGPWTAHYIALRAAREPDAFPASDIGLLRGLTDSDGRRPTPAELERRAEAWRPWRAYAAQHLWAADAKSWPATSQA